ncbi:transcriptional regulator [Terriglobus roseus DSM 18391]|uniref:Transcriptional regulator n=1 Tax=Terriglobus roseus (strain DSM 18391 / NRRL B-41598 / KBS 63) TaxID=926566 RepID=I3ZHQ9_TERRK|nr:TetR family transcriptional regulator [Terriglobus roseus]AFL88435.1 transcriptional regulator [Terriglobus roseus DSM 18391]AFL88777.1 transcriptional regulator [Terriglobus roseus DSM 18391]
MSDAEQFDENSRSAPPQQSRKQNRSLLTRQQLIDAARKIFARDGFEKASLQDISNLAGKTRGAFYTHFADKEDVFFAIFEQYLADGQEQFRQRMKGASTKAKRIAALAAHIVQIIGDKERALLALEFKIYVLRHPHDQQRLTDLHNAVCRRGCGPDMEALMPEFRRLDNSIESRRQVAQMGALVDGLALNHFFDPGSLDTKTLLKQAAAGIQALL